MSTTIIIITIVAFFYLGIITGLKAAFLTEAKSFEEFFEAFNDER